MLERNLVDGGVSACRLVCSVQGLALSQCDTRGRVLVGRGCRSETPLTATGACCSATARPQHNVWLLHVLNGRCCGPCQAALRHVCTRLLILALSANSHLQTPVFVLQSLPGLSRPGSLCLSTSAGPSLADLRQLGSFVIVRHHAPLHRARARLTSGHASHEYERLFRKVPVS